MKAKGNERENNNVTKRIKWILGRLMKWTNH